MKQNTRCFLLSLLRLGLLSLLCTSIYTASAASIDEELVSVKQSLGTLARQLIMQQFATEERVRSEGDSGIKRVRMKDRGTRPYHSDTFARHSIASIHDHSNSERTLGMGEIVAVLNGIEFRTRHNDYLMNMPSTSSSEYDAVEDIDFPEVPLAVTSKASVPDQIIEMREWFKAFRDQDHSVRDYRPYFKPVLCYLEGAWTITDKAIEEPFKSDRHALDAVSFYNLQQKIRFTSYTGTKSHHENLAYLPVKIMDMINDTVPQFAQWNYRVLCNPLKDDLPLDRLNVIDDLATRMTATKKSIPDLEGSRAARFHLATNSQGPVEHGSFSSGLLDALMGQIPGKDNHGGYINDFDLGLHAYDSNYNDDTLLNAAYYHRIFRSGSNDAMGSNMINRGFADQNLFVAFTTQRKVAAISANQCEYGQCTEYSQRVSYAIPLEIIYLTPLKKWNPYNLVYKGDAGSPDGMTVKANGRNGETTFSKAYDGTNDRVFYKVPVEFFTGGEINIDSADTTKPGVGVLDQNGQVKQVSASGIRILLPNIPGVGIIRTRYPIMPVHDEGHNTRKELEALKDVVLDLSSQMHMIRNPPEVYSFTEQHDGAMELVTGFATDMPPGIHRHDVFLTPSDMMVFARGGSVKKYTGEANGHRHYIEINKHGQKYHIERCDDRTTCGHHHGWYLDIVS